MAEALPAEEPLVPAPDISHLVMEDDEPVDGAFSERQMRLLVDALYDSWEEGRPFVAQANVGVFYGIHEKPVVPDVFVSRDVTQRQDVFDRGRSYLVWEYGKPPDIAIEVVSNATGGEEEKLDRYATAGVTYVVVYDPEGHLSNRPVRVWGRHLKKYVELLNHAWLPDLDLGLTEWKGTFQGIDATWLRWCRQDGSLLLLGHERADRLAARLRELGVDPGEL